MALVKALRDKDPAIWHSPSNESLFTDLQKVLMADPKIVSKTIAFRIPAERDEIRRIIGHLPLIRQVRKDRAARKSSGQKKTAEEAPKSARGPASKEKMPNTGGGVVAQGQAATFTPRPPPKDASKEARPNANVAAKPKNAWGTDDTPTLRRKSTPRADPPARSATPQPVARVATTPLPPRAVTPQARSGTPRMDSSPQAGIMATPSSPKVAQTQTTTAEPATAPQSPASPRKAAESPKKAQTPRPASRQEARPATSMGIAAPTLAAQTPRPASHQEARPASSMGIAAPTLAAEASPSRTEGGKDAWFQTSRKTAAAGARLGFAGMPLADEVPRVDEKAMQEMNQRQLDKLAEVGIDPEGLSATQLLQLLYARREGTTYAQMNKEAQNKLLVRVKTPVVFRGVLHEEALAEVKRARDLPATEIHDCLDKWEIDALAEVCRSAKHFDEDLAGPATNYTRQFGGRRYRETINRKKYKRPPTP